MEYTIRRLNNRVVDLDEDIVAKYCEMSTLRDQPFSIMVRSRYGHVPSEKELSRRDLSLLCNEVLLDEMKALCLLPKALEKADLLREASENNELVEYAL